MHELTITELAGQRVELLPARETLNARGSTTFNVATITASNMSAAVNWGSVLAWANSTAAQAVVVNQH